MSDLKGKIKEFIVENFLFGEGGEDLKDSDSFLEKGIIDSTGVLELVEWIEESFEIKVEDEELIPENLDSIENLAAYIKRKRG
jgi:acyl carrier protein